MTPDGVFSSSTSGIAAAAMIDRNTKALMKPTTFLLNTARGGLIDEPALHRALSENKLAGAALDVLSEEPPPADHLMLSTPRCLINPHIAWATREARQRLLDESAANLAAYLAGEQRNRVA